VHNLQGVDCERGWEQVAVPALKEKLAALVGVPADNQRLICRGKVLKDDQLLSAYSILLLSSSNFHV
jgi:hypothetical protein